MSPSQRHVCNMSGTFPTKHCITSTFPALFPQKIKKYFYFSIFQSQFISKNYVAHPFNLTPWLCLSLKHVWYTIFLAVDQIMVSMLNFWSKQVPSKAEKRLVFYKELANCMLLGFTPFIDCYIWKRHWRQHFMVLHLTVLQNCMGC